MVVEGVLDGTGVSFVWGVGVFIDDAFHGEAWVVIFVHVVVGFFYVYAREAVCNERDIYLPRYHFLASLP